MAFPGRSYPLEEFMAWHKLPAKVLVTSGYSDGDDEEDSLSSGEIITIEEVAAGQSVLATDGLGREHTLPTYTKRLYEILPDNPLLDDVTYPTIEQLMKADPAPQKVRVLDSVDTGDEDTTLYEGDIITIKGKRGKSLLVENQFGMDFALVPEVHCLVGTQLDESRYTMSQLLEHSFPLRVRLVGIGDGESDGAVQGHSIYELREVQDETEVYAKFGDELVCIPLRTDIQVALLEGSVLPIPKNLRARTSTTSILTIRSNYSNREFRCIGGGKAMLSPRSSCDGRIRSDDIGANLVPQSPSPQLSVSNREWSSTISRTQSSTLHNVVKHQMQQINALESQVSQLAKERDFWVAKFSEYEPVTDSTFLAMAEYCKRGVSSNSEDEDLPALYIPNPAA